MTNITLNQLEPQLTQRLQQRASQTRKWSTHHYLLPTAQDPLASACA